MPLRRSAMQRYAHKNLWCAFQNKSCVLDLTGKYTMRAFIPRRPSTDMGENNIFGGVKYVPDHGVRRHNFACFHYSTNDSYHLCSEMLFLTWRFQPQLVKVRAESAAFCSGLYLPQLKKKKRERERTFWIDRRIKNLTVMLVRQCLS